MYDRLFVGSVFLADFCFPAEEKLQESHKHDSEGEGTLEGDLLSPSNTCPVGMTLAKACGADPKKIMFVAEQQEAKNKVSDRSRLSSNKVSQYEQCFMKPGLGGKEVVRKPGICYHYV